MNNKEREHYMERIRKTLAMAKSPNQFEAESALLKAREMMAKYKLTAEECEDVTDKTVTDIKTGWSATRGRDPWIFVLAEVIGTHFCCKAYTSRKRGKKTYEVGFIGLKDDVMLCKDIYDYAVSCVMEKEKEIRRGLSDRYTAGYIRKQCNSYGYGFAIGIHDAFKKQQKQNEQEWGLIFTTPKEVDEATRDMGKSSFKHDAKTISAKAYVEGLADGKDFNYRRVLKTEATA